MKHPEFAVAALKEYRSHSDPGNHDDDPQAHLSDLLADLRHVADVRVLDFEAALRVSEMHHRAER